MATATKVPSHYKVTLTMSREEAEMLLCMTRLVGGDKDVSQRRHASAIERALTGAGVEVRPSHALRMSGEIYCES